MAHGGAGLNLHWGAEWQPAPSPPHGHAWADSSPAAPSTAASDSFSPDSCHSFSHSLSCAAAPTLLCTSPPALLLPGSAALLSASPPPTQRLTGFQPHCSSQPATAPPFAVAKALSGGYGAEQSLMRAFSTPAIARPAAGHAVSYGGGGGRHSSHSPGSAPAGGSQDSSGTPLSRAAARSLSVDDPSAAPGTPGVSGLQADLAKLLLQQR